jgi:hypothetical protein
MRRGRMQGGFFRLTTPAAGPEAKDGTTHGTEDTGTGTTNAGGSGAQSSGVDPCVLGTCITVPLPF